MVVLIAARVRSLAVFVGLLGIIFSLSFYSENKKPAARNPTSSFLDAHNLPRTESSTKEKDWKEGLAEFIRHDQEPIQRQSNGTLVVSTQLGFRGLFSSEGLHVQPDADEESTEWHWKYRLTSLSRMGDTRTTLKQVNPNVEGNTLSYAYQPGLTELWENRPDGIEQKVVLRDRPHGDTWVVLEGTCQTDLKAKTHADRFVWRRDALAVLGYKDLLVYDADGKTLPSRMELVGERLSLSFDDTGARYPVVVDPLLTTPAWTADPTDQMGAEFGYSVASAGDVNGDGFSDVIVGAYLWGTGEGRAYVYHGSASGLSAGDSPDWTADPTNQMDAEFGCSVAGAGDVNGDGFDDVIVGACAWDSTYSDEGRAYVYYGSASGLSPGDSPDWTADPSDQDGAGFGFSVAGTADVNGDGFSDVIIGAHFYNGEQSDEGRAYVYYGSDAGLSPGDAPDWIADPSDQDGARFADIVASAGDVNNDGFSDIIIGGYSWDDVQANEGRVWVYHGSATGLSAGDAPDWIADPTNQGNSDFGSSVASAGDVNADGFDDVIIGASGWNNGEMNEGRAYVYYGSVSGLTPGDSPDWMADPTNQSYPFFGGVVASAGDVNGDYFSDVIIAAPAWDDSGFNEGRVFVYYGSTTGLTAGDSPDWTTDATDQDFSYYGSSVASAGDVDGDGVADVIIGAMWYTGVTADEGRAYVFYGESDCVPIAAEDTTCDNIDDDCEGGIDEDYVVDSSCGIGACEDANTPSSCVAGVETPCTPGPQDEASDITCDNIDGDCDGQTDEDYLADSACGQGACAIGNTPSTCTAGVESPCVPGPQAEATDATCDDIDGDCDGLTDEDYVVVSSCGTGVCENGSTPSTCVAGVETPCLPGSPAEASDITCDNIDGDCDGQTDEDYLADSACGQGACAIGNTPSTCSAGVETPCVPGPQAEATDTTCDDIDGDCDGLTDEDYVVVSSCGTGVCENGSTPSNCVAGAETPCSPGSPAEASDITCDNIDGDCDGQTDEDFQPDDTCGIGACGDAQTPSTCVAGVETPCTPGPQAEASDITCDNIDGDCDGQTDEDYQPDDTCGLGACENGEIPSSCVDGIETPCRAGPQAELSDVTCDNIDGDCDGMTDEDYVVDASCGVGACENGEIPSFCQEGVETACIPGPRLSDEDANCDGVDDNCDGFTDEGVRLDPEAACGSTNTCESVVCSPISGSCETSWRSGCCEDDDDCVTASECVQRICNTNLGVCEVASPSACCQLDNDCDDSNPCTLDHCQPDQGRCQNQPLQDCCLTNADCDDGEGCTYDWCSEDRRCLHGLVSCETQTPCGADSSCVYSGLYVRLGEASPEFVKLKRGKTKVILQLHLTNEGLAAQLRSLRLGVQGFSTSSLGPEGNYALLAELHIDKNGDGLIDEDGSALGPSATVDTQQGQVVFRDLSFSLSPAWAGSLLVALRLEDRSSASVASGWIDAIRPAFPGIGILVWTMLFFGFMLILVYKRSFVRFATCAVVLTIMVVLPISCSRAGFEGMYRGSLVLENNDAFELDVVLPRAVDVETAKVEIQGTTIESSRILLILSD